MLKPRTYTMPRPVNAYFEQMLYAQRMFNLMIQRLLDAGYVFDPARGCYVSRDGKSEVWVDG